MAMTQKQQRAIEEIINDLETAKISADPRRWIDRAEKALIEMISKQPRSLDPMPYKHRAYGDRAVVKLSSFIFQPRPQYEQSSSRYPMQRYAEIDLPSTVRNSH